MTQTFSFNLVEEPWIPCVDKNGATIELNLRELFAQAHQLRTIAGDSPPVTAALHRFLLAILHRVFGPADEETWVELWESEQWDMELLNTYLDEWYQRFDLFDGERPFYQTSNLTLESNWVSVRRLAHHLSARNTLFDHYDTQHKGAFQPSDIARMLIAAQGFSLCGTSGAFFPQKKPTDKKKQSMFADGLSARGINFLVIGNTLFETLMLNLIQYPDEQVITHFEDDLPSWERNDSSGHNRGIPTGYLDYLTWQNRRILLKPETDPLGGTVVRSMRWEPGPNLEFALRDPMQHHIKNKKEGFQNLRFDEDKVLWRDSAALLSVHQTNSNQSLHFPPATLRWLKELRDPMLDLEAGIEETHIFQCLALGMSSKRGQASVYFYREERISFPLAYFHEPKLVSALHDALGITERVAKDLVFSAQIVGMHWQLPEAENKKWGGLNRNAKSAINNWIAHTGMERNYWASLDTPFQSFIIDLAQDQEQALAEWNEQLRRSASDAFDLAAECVGNDGRSFKAVVRGRSYLNYRLNEVLPSKEKTT